MIQKSWLFGYHLERMLICNHVSIGLPSSVCVVDCAINGFIGDQISLSKGDALVFKNRIK